MMKHTTARALYNDIGQKYHDNRGKATNDITELPETLKLLGDLKEKRLLDMGCGLGKYAKEFIKRGAVVTGYDASEKMVSLTKKLCKKKGEFFRATHENATLPPNTFDICNASLTLNYCKDLDVIFKKVNGWLKPNGIFTFSMPHPIWLLNRSETMDYSKPHKIYIKMNSYGVEVFNYYHPLETFIKLANKYHFQLTDILETTVSRRYKGWPEEKYRLPNALIFKLQKIS